MTRCDVEDVAVAQSIRDAYSKQAIIWIPDKISQPKSSHARGEAEDNGRRAIPGTFYRAEDLAWNDPSLQLDMLDGPPRIIAPHFPVTPRGQFKEMRSFFQINVCFMCLDGGFGSRGREGCAECAKKNQGKMCLGGKRCLVSIHATVPQHLAKLQRLREFTAALAGDRAKKVLQMFSVGIFIQSMSAEARSELMAQLKDMKVLPAMCGGSSKEKMDWVAASDYPVISDDRVLAKLFGDHPGVYLIDFGNESPSKNFTDKKQPSDFGLRLYYNNIGILEKCLRTYLSPDDHFDVDSWNEEGVGFDQKLDYLVAVCEREASSLRPLLHTLGIRRLSAAVERSLKVEGITLDHAHPAFEVISRSVGLAQRWLHSKHPSRYRLLKKNGVASVIEATKLYTARSIQEKLQLDIPGGKPAVKNSEETLRVVTGTHTFTDDVDVRVHMVGPEDQLKKCDAGAKVYVSHAYRKDDHSLLFEQTALFFCSRSDKHVFKELVKFLDSADVQISGRGPAALDTWLLEDQRLALLPEEEPVWQFMQHARSTIAHSSQGESATELDTSTSEVPETFGKAVTRPKRERKAAGQADPLRTNMIALDALAPATGARVILDQEQDTEDVQFTVSVQDLPVPRTVSSDATASASSSGDVSTTSTAASAADTTHQNTTTATATSSTLADGAAAQAEVHLIFPAGAGTGGGTDGRTAGDSVHVNGAAGNGVGVGVGVGGGVGGGHPVRGAGGGASREITMEFGPFGATASPDEFLFCLSSDSDLTAFAASLAPLGEVKTATQLMAAVGRRGEEAAVHWLKQRGAAGDLPVNLFGDADANRWSFCWENEEGEKGLPWDITCTSAAAGSAICIEVKSTSTTRLSAFEMSANELLEAHARGSEYAIMRMSNVPKPQDDAAAAMGNDRKPMGVTIIRNPWKAIESNTAQITLAVA